MIAHTAMTPDELAKLVERAACRVIGWPDAGNAGHRLALAVLVRAFDNSDSALLCEPSLARKTNRPPDIVLIDPEIGVHVVEIKSIELDQIEAVEAGGQMQIRYGANLRMRNPIAQVRNAMFDIKDATIRSFGGEVRFPFRYWVVFPFISRAQWLARFGSEGFCPPEFVFADELVPRQLLRKLGATDRRGSNQPIALCPLDQLQCVWRAFGDTSVLYASPEDRQPRRVGEGTLGELFDESADAYKCLSDDQQRLSSMNWEGGPRLVRGVAGSGKTIVLANNLARRVERMLAAAQSLFDNVLPRPKILAVCFNRTLAPFIEKKINIAFQQRTGRPVPDGIVEACSFNSLMWKLTNAGVWRYQSVSDVEGIVRAMQYLGDLAQFRQRDPQRLSALAYDAIYVDEGQDFLEEEFRLLKELCRTPGNAEPNLYVFYDDAQNLYGRGRPNWQSLGLNVRGGRSQVMTECFRNTRAIVEPTFNVLFGTCAAAPGRVPTKAFGDIETLQERKLIEREAGLWRVHFAKRPGSPPRLTFADSQQRENELIVSRLRWLIGEQQVRPQDILVLTFHRERVAQLAEALRKADLPGIAGIHVAIEEKQKDKPLGQRSQLTVSTVASAKGYDAFCVLLASANEFTTDVKGRANFYVGCTRAIEYLEVSAYQKAGLAAEMETALIRLDRGAPTP